MGDDPTARQQADELTALYEVTQELSRHTLDLDRILRLVTERAAQFTQTDSAGLFFWDVESDMLIGQVGYGPSHETVSEMRLPVLPNGAVREAIHTGHPVSIEDAVHDARMSPEFAKEMGIKASLTVPVQLRGQPIAFLFLDDTRRARSFTDQQIRLTIGLAAQAAVAIENARLYRDVERRASELAALIQIDQDISTTLDLPRVLERIASHAKRIVGAEGSDIYLLEPLFAPDADALRAVVSLSEYAEQIKAAPLKLGQGIVGSIVQSGRAEIVNHAESDPRSMHIPDTPLDAEALLCAPLVAQGQVIGAMVLNRLNEGAFDAADLNFLVSLAQQASIAIQNAWLLEAAQRRTQELEALRQTALDVAAQLEMPRLLTTIARRATELLNAHAGSFYLIESDSQTGEVVLRLVAIHEVPRHFLGTHLRLNEGVAGRVAQSGEPFTVEDYWTWPDRATIYDPSPAGSVLGVPIKWGGHVIGVLNCYTLAGEQRTFTAEDIRLLQSFAQQAAVAIENARLFQVEQQRARELSEALERQKELERLQAQFIQNVSHELRTPLALIQGYVEMLVTGAFGDLAQDQQEPVSIIARRTQALTNLVEDITAILELEARQVRPSPVRLGELVQQALADFQTWADQKNITLRGGIVAGTPLVMGEIYQLRKVVDNLISNALKFTPDGGTIDVHLSYDDAGLTLQVIDTGIGIPSDNLERIFERFFQVDGSVRRRFGGTGLGLALVKEILQAHGGTVTVESRVGEGSTFTVWLPRGRETENGTIPPL